MTETATLRLAIDARGAQTGAMGFHNASMRIEQGARRAMLAISAYTTMAVREFVKFEAQMANVSTMLDQQTMGYMPRYGRAMKNMAIASGEATATLSTGLYNILSASIPAEHAISALDATVRAAKAGLTDTATSAYAITGILNAYGLSADRAAYVSDVLFSTVKKGQTTFAQLAPVIGRVTAISSGAGISLEEVSAALSTITRGGISTDEAITGLRQAIIQLQGQQERAVKAARQHGIELSVESLAAEGLTGMVQKLGELSESQIASMFHEVRARMALSVLLKDQAGYVGDLEEAMRAGGKTQEAYAKMTDTLGHRFGRLWQVIKVGMVEYVEPFSGQMKDATDALIEHESEWRKFMRTQGEAVAEIMSGFKGLRTVIAETGKEFLALEQMRRQYASPGGMAYIEREVGPSGPGPGPTWVPPETALPSGVRRSPREWQQILELRERLREEAALQEDIFRLSHRNFPEEEAQAARAAGPIAGEEPMVENAEDVRRDLITMRTRLYDDLGTAAENYFQAQGGLLQNQYEEYRTLIFKQADDHEQVMTDMAALDQWYASELQRLAIDSSGFWIETRNALQQTQSALSDFMMDFGSLSELAESIGQSFQRMFANLASQMLMSGIMNLLVGGPMAGALGFQNPMAGAGNAQMGGLLGGLFKASAFGNVFDRGRIIPMQFGGIFPGPTYFPLAGGKIGLAGEAGAEAAMPLKRMSSGRLGVEMAGAPNVTVQPAPVKVVIVRNEREAALEAMRSDEGQATIVNTMYQYGGS